MASLLAAGLIFDTVYGSKTLSSIMYSWPRWPRWMQHPPLYQRLDLFPRVPNSVYVFCEVVQEITKSYLKSRNQQNEISDFPEIAVISKSRTPILGGAYRLEIISALLGKGAILQSISATLKERACICKTRVRKL